MSVRPLMTKNHQTDEKLRRDDGSLLPALWAGEEAPRVETPWMNLSLYF